MTDWTGRINEDRVVATAPGITITRGIWRQHRDGMTCDYCYTVSVHGREVLTVHEDGAELDMRWVRLALDVGSACDD